MLFYLPGVCPPRQDVDAAMPFVEAAKEAAASIQAKDVQVPQWSTADCPV